MKPTPDAQLGSQERYTLVEEVMALRTAIRACRDAKGDDRCWKDFELKLYPLLPEGWVPPARDETIELENCKEYIRTCYHPGTTYVSPRRRIEELEKEVASTKESQGRRKKLLELAETINAQASFYYRHPDANISGETIEEWAKEIQEILR